MGHHHRREENGIQPSEISDKSEHPFFSEKDLIYLPLILPLLSEQGRKLIAFFIDFGNPNLTNNLPDPSNLLKQLGPKLENGNFKELLPMFLAFLSNPENKKILNPSLLSSLIANFSPKREESDDKVEKVEEESPSTESDQ